MNGSAFDNRIVELGKRPVRGSGSCVVYWMQRSQRASDNLALTFAIERGNELGKPVVAYFGLFEKYPMASIRAFKFMLEGLKETAGELSDRGIGFVMRREHPAEGVARVADELNACAVVADEDYLNVGRSWRALAASKLGVRLYQVDAETIVPARNTDRQEWGAYTIRPKILRALESCFVDLPETEVDHRWMGSVGQGIDIAGSDPLELAASLDVDEQVQPAEQSVGGRSEAMKRLKRFIHERLPRYADERNDIGVDVSSNLSPYLHFGQISSLRAALEVEASDAPEACVDAYLEQLIVRRELAVNYCLFNPNHDSFEGAPDWARASLAQHKADERPDIYTIDELERAETHDELWNAAQTELIRFGRIHGYMRMVWAKKMLEWSPTPQQALERAIYLNDKYALDGRDPNGYANISWCIVGRHDRPFPDRPIFGRVRYMSTEATKRKTRWRDYVARVVDS